MKRQREQAKRDRQQKKAERRADRKREESAGEPTNAPDAEAPAPVEAE